MFLQKISLVIVFILIIFEPKERNSKISTLILSMFVVIYVYYFYIKVYF